MNTTLGIANNGFDFIEKVSNFSRVKARMDGLRRNRKTLLAKKADISVQLEQEERRPGKKRKKEVELWMQRVGLVAVRFRKLRRKVEERHFFSRLLLAPRVRGLAIEMEKLLEEGKFDNGLTQDVKPTRGYELRPGELVGQASQTKRIEIWDCLMNEEVLRVGVWGQEGAGKTFVTKHIHDQIVRHCTRFDGACLVNVSQEGTAGSIQTDIAKYLKLDLTGESAVYWGARLREALQGRRLLLILDDVRKSFSLEEVGIGLERDGCKLIVTSRSREVCEKMNCHELVHVPHGSEEELQRGPSGRSRLFPGTLEGYDHLRFHGATRDL